MALTYNVAGLTDPISGSEPATNSALISPLLNAYDVVLLQEDWADPFPIEGQPIFFYHDEIVSQADHPYRSEPAPHPYGTDLRRAPKGPPLVSDGLNRLSRFPLGPLTREMWRSCHGELAITVAEEVIKGLGLEDLVEDAGLGDVVDGGATDCAAQKGFSVSTIEFAPGVTVDLYNLHGEAGNGPRDQEASADNYEQLAEYINTHSAGNAIILGGDTNLNTGEPDRPDGKVWTDFLEATGIVDVCDAVHCGDDAGEIDKFVFRSGGGVRIIPQDHSFERETFQRADGEPLSDHDALAVTFRWVAQR